MSNGSIKPFQLDYSEVARKNIRDLHAKAKSIGKRAEFVRILNAAVELMRTKPNEWGDPEYRAKSVDAVMCHGILGPLMFRFAIYESVRGVVLLSVQQIRDF